MFVGISDGQFRPRFGSSPFQAGPTSSAATFQTGRRPMNSLVLRRDPQAFDLEITRLNPTFAGIVENVDLSQHQSTHTIALIREALMEHKLLVFRDQRLTPQQQSDFAAQFGALYTHPLLDHDEECSEISVLNYNQDRPPEPDEWQADASFIETPPLASILHGAVIPETGGDILFADSAAAYAALSEPMRLLLQGLRATHDFTKSFRASAYHGENNAKWSRAYRNNPPISHPVVRTHPETGTKTLFVNEAFTTRIEGLKIDEGRTLLDFLIRHQARPQFVYRHRWRTGDVLFWDSRATQHMFVADFWPQPCRMHNAIVLEDQSI
jgi:taurine dioxygenase